MNESGKNAAFVAAKPRFSDLQGIDAPEKSLIQSIEAVLSDTSRVSFDENCRRLGNLLGTISYLRKTGEVSKEWEAKAVRLLRQTLLQNKELSSCSASAIPVKEFTRLAIDDMQSDLAGLITNFSSNKSGTKAVAKIELDPDKHVIGFSVTSTESVKRAFLVKRSPAQVLVQFHLEHKDAREKIWEQIKNVSDSIKDFLSSCVANPDKCKPFADDNHTFDGNLMHWRALTTGAEGVRVSVEAKNVTARADAAGMIVILPLGKSVPT